ncbi:MAG: metal-sensing transcriptional repressor [Coriobacteriales bacterium]|nr:metal-sensing transcriptional repressor [Coriobacteriales bacterium]
MDEIKSEAEKQPAEQPGEQSVEPCACARYKATPRDEALKRSVMRRLNRAIGQLNGVRQMIEDDRYCGDVLTQLAAAESAVRAVSREVLRDHLHTCVVERVQAGDTEVVDEVCDLLRKFA